MSGYVLKTAISGIWREKWINLLCVLTITTGIFLMASALLFVYNVDMAVKSLPDKFSINVFLKDGVAHARAKEIVAAIEKDLSVSGAKYISSDEALRELRTGMKDADYVLEGLEENPLPASVEVRLRRSAVAEGTVRSLAEKLRKVEGVSDVEYGEKLLQVIQSARVYTAAFSSALIGVLAAGLMFVCYSTVKILFYRKKDEVETLKLLGATRWFVRAPFVMEGGILGVTGGVLSSVAMFTAYSVFFVRVAEAMPLARALSAPPQMLLYMSLAGALIGLVGAFTAMGRIRF